MDAPATSSEKHVKERVPMSRPGYGTKGREIQLCTNHYKVNLTHCDDYFFHYSVALFYEDGKPVEQKGVGRKVMDKIQETYKSEIGGKDFAYDGEKTLFTVGALPQKKMEFTVVLDKVSSDRTDGKNSPGGGSPSENDKKRRKRISQTKTFKVEISFATKIAMRAITDALRGKDSQEYLEAIRVFDVVLRQHAAKQGCLLVRQSFFHDDDRNYQDLGGGILGCRGFHSSFRATQDGLSLNMDGTLTTVVQPGPLVDFLIANQNVRDPFQVDWVKAKRLLKNLRIKVEPSNTEWKICGLSDDICKKQMFMLRRAGERGGDKFEEIEISVYEYFVEHRKIDLRYSGDIPCVNVGRPKRPTYVPIELCSLLPLQRYTKALTVQQRSAIVEKSRQKPQEKMRILTEVVRSSNYAADPMLRTCGVSISNDLMQVQGRVLTAPKLKFGDGEEFPRGGRWNVNRKRFVEAISIKRWAVVNFSARCDIRSLCKDLEKFGKSKGLSVEQPLCTIEESPQLRRAPPPVRVDKMIAQLISQIPDGPPLFILCVLADRKNSEIYGPWKKKVLVDLGIVSQCLAPARVNEQYLTNLLLKINVKLGGLNSLLAVERNIPIYSEKPNNTIIFGMDVSHGSPGQSGVPSIAAVVSTRWASLYRYRASIRSQSPKVEMIDSLFKPLPGNKDGGIIRELMTDFYISSGKHQQKPEQVIIFRDGVSESQFKQVLNIEFEQILEACKFLQEDWRPKFTIVVAQKNHHTKFFQSGNPDNVPPGTVVDKKVCHPQYYDFYMCAHAGMIGTSRPTHYHVLLDENGFSPDGLQELIHSLSYVYQRSTTAISIVAPIRYAHLAASQVSQFLKYEDISETSSAHGSMTSAGNPPVPDLPRLHDRVCTSMFFC